MEEKKRFPYITLANVALLLILGLLLALAAYWTTELDDEVDWPDVVSEGGIVLFSIAWIILIQKTYPSKTIFFPLAAGFSILFLAYFKDVLDEFWDLGDPFDLLENIGSWAGMLLAGIGLFFWTRSLERSQAELEEKVRLRTRELSESNTLLRSEIVKRKESEDSLRLALEEKEVLLKEIHHRVKNNLQVISSLLSLESGQIQNEELSRIFSENQARIRSIALVHEELYRSDNMARVDLLEYVRELTEQLVRAYGIERDRVDIQVRVEGVALSIEQAFPCGLIINELLSNSIKHAFPEGQKGRITVSMKKEGDRLLLEVADNGVGLGEEDSARSSLGLELVKSLVEQLNGRMEMESGQGLTTRVIF